MNQDIQTGLTLAAEDFMAFIGIQGKPSIKFISIPSNKEYKLNDIYPKEKDLILNTDFFENMSFEYSLLIILHEIYHFTAQNIIDINDVVYIRDSKHWEVMQLCDIEADVVVIQFLHQCDQIKSWEEYLAIIYSGLKIFRDRYIRLPKLERFIGTTVTIKYYFTNKCKTIYLPLISLNEILLTKIYFNSSHLEVQHLSTANLKLEQWMCVYQGDCVENETTYIENVTELVDIFCSQTLTQRQYA